MTPAVTMTARAEAIASFREADDVAAFVDRIGGALPSTRERAEIAQPAASEEEGVMISVTGVPVADDFVPVVQIASRRQLSAERPDRHGPAAGKQERAVLGIVGVRLGAEKPGHAAAVVHRDDDAIFAAEGADIRHAEVAIQKDAIAGGHVVRPRWCSNR